MLKLFIAKCVYLFECLTYAGIPYRCGALDPTSCTPLSLHGLTDENYQISGVDQEKKENMWMGVSLTSSYVTGAIATCGHRYDESYSDRIKNYLLSKLE